jgi:hypothetical protein
MSALRRSVLAALVLALGCLPLPAEEEYQRVPFWKLVDRDDLRSVPIEIEIPARYQPSGLVTNSSSRYWMPRDRVAEVERTRSMPDDTGFVIAKVNTDLTYDAERGVFYGWDAYRESEGGGFHPDPVASYREAGLDLLDWRRAETNGHRAILATIRPRGGGKVKYSAHVATLHDGVVYTIGYMPPDGDPDGGAATWGRIAASFGRPLPR